jgi:MSHA biogenesis protein MshK
MKRAVPLRRFALAPLALSWVALCWLGSSPAEELRDPTQPPRAVVLPSAPASAGAARPARLEAVLHAGDRAVAIIDGKLLRVGDWLGDARVAAIDSDAVHLTREGRKLTLRLANKAMKVRRTASSKDPE